MAWKSQGNSGVARLLREGRLSGLMEFSPRRAAEPVASHLKTASIRSRVADYGSELLLPLLAVIGIVITILGAASLVSLHPGSDHVVERAVLEDPSARLGVEDVVGMQFAPVKKLFSEGFTPSAHWFRLRVRPQADGRPLVLYIRPTFLDRVTLFEPDSSGAGWQRRETGDLLPFRQREAATVALTFEIRPAAPDTVYFLRLETTSSSLFGVEAIDWRDVRQAELASDALLVLFLAIAACILFWSIGDFVRRPAPITVLFIASQLCYIVSMLAVMGYIAALMPEAPAGRVSGLTSALVCLAPALGVMLHRQVFLLYAPATLVSTVSWMMLGCSAVLIAILMAGHAQFALRLNSMLLFASSAFYFAMAVWPWRDGVRSPLLRTLYGVQAVAFAVTVVPLLGIGNLGEWTYHYPYILVLMYGAQMFFLIQRRARERDARAAENRARLDLVTQALDAARRQRDVQDRFAAMLVHEIRNPLAAIQLSIDPARLGPERYRDIRAALCEIDAIVRRSSQPEEADPKGGATRFDLAEALRGVVASHSPVNPLEMQAREPVLVASDRQMVDMVLSNLVENAIKHAPAGSRIVLACRRLARGGADGAVVTIENALLPDMAPDPARVFDKFYRAPGSRGVPGSGLGLYIVQGVTEMLAGRVGCTVAQGRIRLEFWLPAVPPDRDPRHALSGEADRLRERPGRR